VGVQQNVNNQVSLALKKYAQKINSGQLAVIGAVYDFADDLHKGVGELLIINVNGVVNQAKIKQIISRKINT
jgi:carbonic anhydrase